MVKNKEEAKKHKVIVPALDALIGNPDLLRPEEETAMKAEIMIIPSFYIEKCAHFKNELSNRGDAARILNSIFAEIAEAIYLNESDYVCKNGMKIRFAEMPDGAPSKSAPATISVAKSVKIDGLDQKDVAIMTGDDSLAAQAALSRIDVAHINREEYTGRIKLELSIESELYSQWCSKGYISLEDFKAEFPDVEIETNMFIEWKINDSTDTTARPIHFYIGRLTAAGIIEQLHYIEAVSKFIKPRTAGQAMFLEALLAPVEEIPIVVCSSPFGTGKTYLAVAIAAYLTFIAKNPWYLRIIVCPRDSQLGEGIGYLPGDQFEKTIAKAMPILDNLIQFLMNKGDKEKGGQTKKYSQVKMDANKYLMEYFELVPLINMGGRTFANSFIIYDEAQEFERFQILQLLQRIGDGSKIVVTGDPNQTYKAHLNKYSNGLSYAANKLRGNKSACIITMMPNEITRSSAAREISKCFS